MTTITMNINLDCIVGWRSRDFVAHAPRLRYGKLLSDIRSCGCGVIRYAITPYVSGC